MALPVYDDALWPMVRVTISAEPFTDEELQEHLTRTEAYFRRQQPFVLLFDHRKAPMLEAKHRQVVATHARQVANAYPGICRGVAFIGVSALHRGVVSAVLWLYRPPVPVGVFGTEPEAMAWASHVLATSPKTTMGTVRGEPRPLAASRRSHPG